MRARTSWAWCTTSYPSTVARPEVGAEQRAEDLDQGGLPGAVGAQEADDLPGGHRQRHRTQRRHRRARRHAHDGAEQGAGGEVRLGEVLDLKHS